MASLTDNLKIVNLALGEEGYGEFTDYGSVQDANWQIVENALTAKSDITINTANVTLNDAQQVSLFLNLTGTLTGDRDLVLKADQKGFWFVKNSTAGDYTVTVKPSGGTGFELFPDAWSIVLSDGETASLVATSATVSDPVGDFKSTTRTLSADWLRRDGALYDAVDYPVLAALLPELDDSVDWDTEAANTTGEAFSIVQAEGRLTAVFNSGVVVASVSGGAWNVRATITGASNPVVAYGASTFVAVDGNGKGASSPDGDTWSSAAFIDTGTIGCNGIAFGAGVFVAVGLKDGGGGGIWTSPDGATWTERTSGSASILNGIDFVNSVFIATGNSGVILTSTDGTTWTSRTSGSASALYAAAYLGGTYAVCGASGTILTSTNLSGWTSRTSGVSTTLRSIIANTLGFLVVGASGVARISDDAITWSPTTTGLTSTLYDAIYDSADDALYYVSGNLTSILYGVRTLPTQFRVPDDDPTYGWIKALP